jgi:GntR family transcriptional regulator, galactonate operon transcriptional repressor
MERAYHRIMSEILDDVVRGTLPRAGWLPRVDEIAARHACSLTVAREAVRALEERGVVAVHAGRGQQVLDPSEWALLDRDVLDAVLRHRDRALLREAVDALRLIEVQAGILAAPRATGGDLTWLERIVDEMRRAGRGGNGARGGDDTFADAEARFHRVLVAASGNRFLGRALAGLHPALARARRAVAADRDPVAVRLHEAILAGLAAHDPTAVAAAVESYSVHLGRWLRA